MALVSMTGFADAQGANDWAHWRWEAKSVNGRSLEVRLRLPPGFDGLEASARSLAARYFKLVLEPGGAIGIACACLNRDIFRGKTVVAVATGGNIDLPDYVAMLGVAAARPDYLGV